MFYNLLAQIKNARAARKENFQAAYSQMSFAIAKVLAQHHFIRDVQKRTVNRKQYLDIRLSPVTAPIHFRSYSKPGRRVYRGYRELQAVRQHYGLAIMSTSQGIMTNLEARKQKLGGEYLFEVW
ncbi:MAG: 30S ribosomal protein S8 [Candidatus Liptonbacteria bacterium]|nr:30S ribosomal protein S8 [Candidatus Liptonbacteria bacterium]